METLSPLRKQRREKILDAAERLFIADGVRATTIEGLAVTVGMSKVTVYSYFEDKDAVFAAVADRVATRIATVFHAELDGDGTAQERIAAALIAKHRLVHDLVRRSAHAEELFSAKTRTSSGRFQEVDQRMIAQIGDVLRPVVQAPLQLATLLFNASQGIANGADSFAILEENIQDLMGLVDGQRIVSGKSKR